jgi:hypothetical protein
VAYIRLTEEGSQVYVYMSGEHNCLTCLNCTLLPEDQLEFLARTTAQMVAHLKEHRAAGETVPDVAFERLERDAAQNDLEMRSSR